MTPCLWQSLTCSSTTSNKLSHPSLCAAYFVPFELKRPRATVVYVIIHYCSPKLCCSCFHTYFLPAPTGWVVFGCAVARLIMLRACVHGRTRGPFSRFGHAQGWGSHPIGMVSRGGTCRPSTDDANTERTWGAEVKHRLQVYSQLSKYRLSALVMFTTSAGYLAAGGPVEVVSLSSACVGTMLSSCAANTFNHVIETSNDSRMKRTRNRPLPSGRISRSQALGWGAGSGTAGIAVLAAGSNPVTAALGAANLLLYVGPYTLSKPRTELNTWIGSLVGAVPPLMGWAAATGGEVAAVEPMLMAAYLFIWQFPHFFSLAWIHREDYARGGFKMVRAI